MKLIYGFLAVYSLKIVCMDKPRVPLGVKAAAAAWPSKPAAAGFLVNKSAAGLKRSSDEEEGLFQRRRRRSNDRVDVDMAEAPKLDSIVLVQSLIDEVKTEIRQGRLKIISTSPPVCEVIPQLLPWKCRYGCRHEFTSKAVENEHIRLFHNIIPASWQEEWGIDWEEISKFKDCVRPHTPPVPEDQQEEVEEII